MKLRAHLIIIVWQLIKGKTQEEAKAIILARSVNAWKSHKPKPEDAAPLPAKKRSSTRRATLETIDVQAAEVEN